MSASAPYPLDPAPALSASGAEALADAAEEVRAWLVSARGGAPFDGNLMVVADEDTPYDIVAKVLYAAGKSRFTTYRLVVRRK